MIKYYFNEISTKHGSSNIKHILLLIVYLFNFTKTLILLSCELTHKTRLILFDVSLFMGGIPVFIRITILFTMLFGFTLKILFQFTNSCEKMVYWQKLFTILYTNSSQHSRQLHLNSNHLFLIIGLRHKFHIVSKIVSIAIVSVCKY